MAIRIQHSNYLPLLHNLQASVEAQLRSLSCGDASSKNLNEYIQVSISPDDDFRGGVLAPCRRSLIRDLECPACIIISSLMSDKQALENSYGWLLALVSRWRSSENSTAQRDAEREAEIRDVLERLKELEEMVGDFMGVTEAEKKMERWLQRWRKPDDYAVEEDW